MTLPRMRLTRPSSSQDCIRAWEVLYWLLYPLVECSIPMAEWALINCSWRLLHHIRSSQERAHESQPDSGQVTKFLSTTANYRQCSIIYSRARCMFGSHTSGSHQAKCTNDTAPSRFDQGHPWDQRLADISNSQDFQEAVAALEGIHSVGSEESAIYSNAVSSIRASEEVY